jgi:CRISPR/Cas system endoribonuclease Cas6 (RAMP superfamily)
MEASLSSQMISLEAQCTDTQTSSLMVNVLSTGQLQDHALLYALDQETNYRVYVLKIKCHPAYKLQLSQCGNQNMSRNVLGIRIYTHDAVNFLVQKSVIPPADFVLVGKNSYRISTTCILPSTLHQRCTFFLPPPHPSSL